MANIKITVPNQPHTGPEEIYTLTNQNTLTLTFAQPLEHGEDFSGDILVADAGIYTVTLLQHLPEGDYWTPQNYFRTTANLEAKLYDFRIRNKDGNEDTFVIKAVAFEPSGLQVPGQRAIEVTNSPQTANREAQAWLSDQPFIQGGHGDLGWNKATQPIPEPTTLAFTVVAALVMIFRRRR